MELERLKAILAGVPTAKRLALLSALLSETAASFEPVAAPPDQVYDVDEAAAYLRVHPQTLRRETKAGRIKPATVGAGSLRKHYRFKRSELDAYLSLSRPRVSTPRGPRRLAA